jgi:prolipoprotein diacylglyceryltransferase
MALFKLKRAWYSIIFFITICWSIPTELLFLILDDEHHLNLSTFLKMFPRFIIGGVCMGVVGYFMYRWKQNRGMHSDRQINRPYRQKKASYKSA